MPRFIHWMLECTIALEVSRVPLTLRMIPIVLHVLQILQKHGAGPRKTLPVSKLLETKQSCRTCRLFSCFNPINPQPNKLNKRSEEFSRWRSPTFGVVSRTLGVANAFVAALPGRSSSRVQRFVRGRKRPSFGFFFHVLWPITSSFIWMACACCFFYFFLLSTYESINLPWRWSRCRTRSLVSKNHSFSYRFIEIERICCGQYLISSQTRWLAVISFI